MNTKPIEARGGIGNCVNAAWAAQVSGRPLRWRATGALRPDDLFLNPEVLQLTDADGEYIWLAPNIHPALLPKYGGKGMYGDHVHKAVRASGDTESGITIHYVNKHYDEGAVVFQATCAIEPSDSYEDIARKVHALEYEHFPKVIEMIFG